MRKLTVPAYLVSEVSTLTDRIRSCSTHKGTTEEEAEGIIKLLPDNLCEAPCFLDRLTGLWRYEFGNPFDGLPNGGLVFGTQMYRPVKELFDVLRCASHRLPKEQLLAYLEKIDDPNKHLDFIFEFAPIVRLSSNTSVEYEVTGYGIGNTTVDWLISKEGMTTVLLEVKNRTHDLLESFSQMDKDGCDDEGNVLPPIHDVSLLFRSIENKFCSRSPKELIQGAWINTELKQEENELRVAFEALDSEKVHFTILGNFKNDVYILSINNHIRNSILSIMQCRESKRFVFSREDI